MRMFKKPPTHTRRDHLKIVNESTPFSILESFRTLCTNVIYLPIESKCKKIVVTSAVSGEGKSYVSTNLSIILTQTLDNKKVLLIDMDLRKPAIQRLFSDFDEEKYDASRGISEYLVGLDEKPNIIPTNVPNLSVLFSGATSMNPAGLINSTKLSRFLDELSEKYDYLIIDTPPITVVSDAMLFEKHIDGYILSVRADYSNTNYVSDAINLLKSVNAEIFGMVLTDVDVISKFRYRYYSSYYKHYYYAYEKEIQQQQNTK